MGCHLIAHMDKPTLPKGYKLVKDAKIEGYAAPAGFRVEREEVRRRMREASGTGKGVKAGPEYRAALDGCIARMRAVEALGDAGVGSFVWYARTGSQPALLAEKYGSDRRWAWIPSQGGYVRLAREEADHLTPLMDFEPGAFVGCTSQGRVPGFASVIHPGFDTPRIRVRMPEPGVIAAAKGGMAPAPAVSRAREREDLIDRIRKAVEGTPNAEEVMTWARDNDVEQLREWLDQPAGEGVEK